LVDGTKMRPRLEDRWKVAWERAEGKTAAAASIENRILVMRMDSEALRTIIVYSRSLLRLSCMQ